MTLERGRRLGGYEIVSPLGAGGMGEVYRARDTRLDRTVAIKVLPTLVADLPERRARFEREARAIAALSHPHICALYDIGDEAGVVYLVMEYLDGETLADRLARGALPSGQVLRYGGEIANALTVAHRSGIAHRDVKPANVMLTKSGVKLLDFGLAKLGGEREAGLLSVPTLSVEPLTGEETLLGTLPYMAPEQVEGKPADARSDIWALGTVLYEMATGHRAFGGNSQASLIGAILKDEPPPIATLQPLAPLALDRVVRGCLEKDPDERWQSAQDVAKQLTSIPESRVRSDAAASRVTPWFLAAFFLLTTSLLLLMYLGFLPGRAGPPQSAIVRFVVPPPISRAVVGVPSISPDGRQLAFVTSDGERSLIWLRAFDSLSLRPLAGTDGASMTASPFWSPDGRYLAFFAGGKLKKMELASGALQVLADAYQGRGGTWSPDGEIVFSAATTGPLLHVPAGGGSTTPVTTLNRSRGEFSHRYPYFLPSGRHLLYWVEVSTDHEVVARGDAVREIQVASLDTKGVLARLPSADSSVAYASPGVLLYQRQHLLVAQPFDSRDFRLSGPPVAIAEGIMGAMVTGQPYGLPGFSVSRSGALAYKPVQAEGSRLTWFDRSGRRLGTVGEPGKYLNHRLSPDGTRVAVARADPETEKTDIWILDLERPSSLRLTFDPVSAQLPVWSPDGVRVAFESLRASGSGIFAKVASGAGNEQPVSSQAHFPLDWSRDGRLLLYRYDEPETRGNIWVLSMASGGQAGAVLNTAADEHQAQLSPSGRWLS